MIYVFGWIFVAQLVLIGCWFAWHAFVAALADVLYEWIFDWPGLAPGTRWWQTWRLVPEFWAHYCDKLYWYWHTPGRVVHPWEK